MACKRTGSIVDYKHHFEAFLPRAGALMEAQWVQIFMAGLQTPLSLNVKIHNLIFFFPNSHSWNLISVSSVHCSVYTTLEF